MRNLFQNSMVSYVSVQGDYFKIDGQVYTCLKAEIQKYSPVRKLFDDGKLKCHSIDAYQSKSGKFCAFCDKQIKCQKKIRLSMALNMGNNRICAVFDINYLSFDNFEDIVATIGEGNLQKTSIVMKVVYDEKDRKLIEFWLPE